MDDENLYNSPYMANKIKEIAKVRNLTMKSILENCNLGSNTFSHMLHGKMIASDSLAKIADYLECSVDYLLGRTDNPEFGTPTLQNSGNHIAFGNSCQNNSIAIGDIARDVSSDTEELEQEICSILKRLPLRKRTELLTIMYHYVDENEEKEGE